MSENPRGLLMKRKSTANFDEVFKEVHAISDMNFEDKVVDLETVRVLDDGNEKVPGIHLEVPGMGVLGLTDWSKRQLGSLLGINFQKWFDPKIVTAGEIQQEMTRRFARTHQSNKIRARAFAPNAPGKKVADGFIRAILSPTYAPIDDIRVFDRLAKRFRHHMSELSFIRNHLGSDFYNDRASHFTVVGEPINMGPIDRKHPDEKVRRIYDMAEREGLLPEDDWVYQGYHMRNSEVGYTAITIDATTFRLVCLNGAVVSVKDGRLLYRMHRGLDDDAIDALLDGSFRKMPGAWDQNKRRLLALQSAALEDPLAEIIKFLDRVKATKLFQDKVKEAYDMEPLATRYGVLQAITRAAQAEEDMDKRFELEELAGKYMSLAV